MTNTLLDAPPIALRHGNEPIIGTPHTLTDFWRWAFSDILNNTTRGIFAEYKYQLPIIGDDKLAKRECLMALVHIDVLLQKGHSSLGNARVEVRGRGKSR